MFLGGRAVEHWLKMVYRSMLCLSKCDKFARLSLNIILALQI